MLPPLLQLILLFPSKGQHQPHHHQRDSKKQTTNNHHHNNNHNAQRGCQNLEKKTKMITVGHERNLTHATASIHFDVVMSIQKNRVSYWVLIKHEVGATNRTKIIETTSGPLFIFQGWVLVLPGWLRYNVETSHRPVKAVTKVEIGTPYMLW